MTRRRPMAAGDPGTPAISIVVPTYESARTIARCLGALAAQQTDLPYEVVLADSGGDDTVARARAALPALRVVRSPVRLTPGAARNAGARAARGALLGFLDSDVYAASDWVASAVAAVRPGVDVVCGAIENANPHSAVSRAEQLIMFNEFLAGSPPGPRWFALSGNLAVRRTWFDAVGGFPDWRGAEDLVFSRRILARGGTVHFDARMRVAHDNRTRLAPFLRNQVMLGRFTATARRRVTFADCGRFAPFVLALPVAPIAKLAKIAVRLWRTDRAQLRGVVRDFPLFFLGLCCYSAGLVRGTLRPLPLAPAAAPEPAPLARAG